MTGYDIVGLVLGTCFAVALGRYLHNVFSGREDAPPVDRTKHDFHGHY